MSGFWDLCEKSVASDLNCKPDTLVAVAHYFLVIHANFKCIGLGESVRMID